MSELAKMIASKEVRDMFQRIRQTQGTKKPQEEYAEWKGMGTAPGRKERFESISSMEIADMFMCQHSKVFQRISKYIGGYAGESEKQEFELSSFKNNQEREFPYWKLTERACEIYIEQICMGKERYITISRGIQKLREEMESRFHPGNMPYESKDFLLEGKPVTEYQDIKAVFDKFITGPALEGREIMELTKRYESFFTVVDETGVSVKQSNKLFEVVSGVAIEAEMQGFIYGFKMFNELLNQSATV